MWARSCFRVLQCFSSATVARQTLGLWNLPGFNNPWCGVHLLFLFCHLDVLQLIMCSHLFHYNWRLLSSSTIHSLPWKNSLKLGFCYFLQQLLSRDQWLNVYGTELEVGQIWCCTTKQSHEPFSWYLSEEKSYFCVKRRTLHKWPYFITFVAKMNSVCFKTFLLSYCLIGGFLMSGSS